MDKPIPSFCSWIQSIATMLSLPPSPLSLKKYGNYWTLMKVYLKAQVAVSHQVMSDALWPHGLQEARLLCPPQRSRGKFIKRSEDPCLARTIRAPGLSVPEQLQKWIRRFLGVSQKEWGWKNGEKEVEGGLSGLFPFIINF